LAAAVAVGGAGLAVAVAVVSEVERKITIGDKG